MPVSRKDIPDESKFVVKAIENWPVYLDKSVAHVEGKLTIDLAGWSTFKRLIIIEN